MKDDEPKKYVITALGLAQYTGISGGNKYYSLTVDEQIRHFTEKEVMQMRDEFVHEMAKTREMLEKFGGLDNSEKSLTQRLRESINGTGDKHG
ncbi:hypothetical protein GOV11_04835 [Candidatus Woesearchaeota archaeon]|nr:hypothetical protein [Candidatus Woesearchaeota archaeon]